MQDMSRKDPSFRNASCPQPFYVVFFFLRQDHGTDLPDIPRPQRQGQCQHRHNDAGKDRTCDHRKQLQPQSQKIQDQQGDKKRRQGRKKIRDRADDLIKDPVFVPRTQNAGRGRGKDHHRHGNDREQHGFRYGIAQLGKYRFSALVRGSHISSQDVSQPADILLRHRIVQPHLLTCLIQRLFGNHHPGLLQHDRSRISGRKIRKKKGQKCDPEQQQQDTEHTYRRFSDFITLLIRYHDFPAKGGFYSR